MIGSMDLAMAKQLANHMRMHTGKRRRVVIELDADDFAIACAERQFAPWAFPGARPAPGSTLDIGGDIAIRYAPDLDPR